MASEHFIAAIDEKGGLELLDPCKPSLQQITSTTLVFICEGKLQSLEYQWNKLRNKIMNHQKLSYLPPIHLGIMWGESQKVNSPYYQAGLPNIEKWTKEALRIIHTFNESEHLEYFPAPHLDRSIRANTVQIYLESPEFIKEHESLRNNPKIYKEFLRIAKSPLIPHTIRHILLLDMKMRVIGNKSAKILLDQAYIGFNKPEVIRVIREVAKLDRINTIVGNISMNDSSLHQVADLIVYFQNKGEMATRDFKNHKPNLKAISDLFEFKGIGIEDAARVLNENYSKEEQDAIVATIQYAIFRTCANDININFVEDFLVTVEQYKELALESAIKKLPGTPMFKRSI